MWRSFPCPTIGRRNADRVQVHWLGPVWSDWNNKQRETAMDDVKAHSRGIPFRQDLLAATMVTLAALAFTATPSPAQQTQRQGQSPQGQTQQQAGSTKSSSADRNTLVLMPSDVEVQLPANQRATKVTEGELYKGVRASRLMDQDVYGSNANEIGEVQDVLVGPDGKIRAIVVEAGGFLDIGDAAFRIPWNEVNLTPGTEGVQIKMTEATAERYDLFDGPETVFTGPREFRLSELIGDYARLQDGTGYGLVSDVVISREGRISGVIVTRDIGLGAGAYGYPYYGYGYGFDPGFNWYGMPYSSPDQAAMAPRIDYGLFDEGLL